MARRQSLRAKKAIGIIRFVGILSVFTFQIEVEDTAGHRVFAKAIREGDRLLIGRDRDCALVLVTDAFVSRKHAVISVSGNGVYIEDLGSRHGTFVENELLSQDAPRRILDGSTVLVGHNELVIHVRPAAQDRDSTPESAPQPSVLQLDFAPEPTSERSATGVDDTSLLSVQPSSHSESTLVVFATSVVARWSYNEDSLVPTTGPALPELRPAASLDNLDEVIIDIDGSPPTSSPSALTQESNFKRRQPPQAPESRVVPVLKEVDDKQPPKEVVSMRQSNDTRSGLKMRAAALFRQPWFVFPLLGLVAILGGLTLSLNLVPFIVQSKPATIGVVVFSVLTTIAYKRWFIPYIPPRPR